MRSTRFVLIAWVPVWLGICCPPAEAVTCTGSQLFYQETGNDSTNFGICGSWGRCQTPVVLSGPTYTSLSSGCDPSFSTCPMQATVNLQFPSNHFNDPAASGFAYSFAEIDLLSSTGSLVGECGYAGQVIQQDFGTATVTASVSCLDPSSLVYTLNLISCPTCSFCPPGFPPSGCITRSPSKPVASFGCRAAPTPEA